MCNPNLSIMFSSRYIILTFQKQWDAVIKMYAKRYMLTQCYGFMFFCYQYSTSQHHAAYWELKSKCSSSGYLSRREELRSPEDCLSTVIIPAQENRHKACRSPDLGLLPFLLFLLVSSCSLSDCLAAAPKCTQVLV